MVQAIADVDVDSDADGSAPSTADLADTDDGDGDGDGGRDRGRITVTASCCDRQDVFVNGSNRLYCGACLTFLGQGMGDDLRASLQDRGRL